MPPKTIATSALDAVIRARHEVDLIRLAAVDFWYISQAFDEISKPTTVARGNRCSTASEL